MPKELLFHQSTKLYSIYNKDLKPVGVIVKINAATF